jgi:hypothetical protein
MRLKAVSRLRPSLVSVLCLELTYQNMVHAEASLGCGKLRWCASLTGCCAILPILRLGSARASGGPNAQSVVVTRIKRYAGGLILVPQADVYQPTLYVVRFGTEPRPGRVRQGARCHGNAFAMLS